MTEETKALAAAIAKWRTACDGDSGDDENDAGNELADAAEALVDYGDRLRIDPEPGPYDDLYRNAVPFRDGYEDEVDASGIVSISDDGGAYVAGWLWVSDEDAGICTECREPGEIPEDEFVCSKCQAQKAAENEPHAITAG